MKLIHFFKKLWTGGIAIRISKYDATGNAKTLGFPKIAPWMITLITTIAFLQHIPLVLAILLPLTHVVVFFGIFYYKVFKSEKPLTKEDAKKDILTIGFDSKKIEFEKSDSEKALEISIEVSIEVEDSPKEVSETKAKEVKPTMDNTKGEIIAYLGSKGIEYKKSDTKALLLSKI